MPVLFWVGASLLGVGKYPSKFGLELRGLGWASNITSLSWSCFGWGGKVHVQIWVGLGGLVPVQVWVGLGWTSTSPSLGWNCLVCVGLVLVQVWVGDVWVGSD